VVIDLTQGYNELEAEIFYKQQYPFLYRYAMYLTGDEESAREFCQETFIRWFTITRNMDIVNPRAWLKKVLSNLVYSDFRHRKVQSAVDQRLQDEILAHKSNSDSDLLRIEVQDVLSRLKWRDQLLLKMRMSGMSYVEIAEALNISTGSVGALLARAMKKFRLEYEGKEAGKQNEMPERKSNLNVFR